MCLQRFLLHYKDSAWLGYVRIAVCNSSIATLAGPHPLGLVPRNQFEPEERFSDVLFLGITDHETLHHYVLGFDQVCHYVAA